MRLFQSSVFTLLSLLVFSQEKFEVEKRISEDQVPQRAISFVNELDLNSKVKWYSERSDKGQSFEAKTKKAPKFSIEFSESGQIQDVERRIKKSELTREKIKSLDSLLSLNFKRYKIKELQIQWKAEEFELIERINLGKSSGDLVESIELELKGVNENSKGYFELLIDKDWRIITLRPIIRRSLENIEI
ncbi:MAG: hypothetical protein HKN45_09810 [Flavobacteriales bacterium]|nr:hypothetical protein [Flavobacteriales bacterium]NNK80761.1 hypothetical protein [Flavobacteriales bacterium]